MADRVASFDTLELRSEGVFAPSAWDFWQRVADAALVVATSPLWGLVLGVTLALKLVMDRGPVLFHHVRLGKDGKPFTLHKIRTTPRDFRARSDDWTSGEFPPRTPLGRWLRRLDLDELPQLWNVLKGEMSLVGPRPEMPFHAEAFSDRLPDFQHRLAVQPGLTGLAQVRGWRGDTSIYQRLRSDLDYIGLRGPRVYLEVLARTVVVEARRAMGKNVY